MKVDNLFFVRPNSEDRKYCVSVEGIITKVAGLLTSLNVSNILFDCQFRYNLKANDAILARDEHKDLYVEKKIFFLVTIFVLIRNEVLLRDYPNHHFVAGGSTQNTMRAATVTFCFLIIY